MFLQDATVVVVGNVRSTTSSPEHAASEPQPQKITIALEVVFFYLHEAFEAARGWSRELKHAGQVLTLWLALTHLITKHVVLGSCVATLTCWLVPPATVLYAQTCVLQRRCFSCSTHGCNFASAGSFGVRLQDDDEANVLPEADVTMVARAIGASLNILQQDHASLLLPFLQKSGLLQTQTSVEH